MHPVIAWITALGLSAPATAARADEWRPLLDGNSESGHFQVSLGPADGMLDIGVMEDWWLQLRNADGSPAPPARLGLDGGMAAHGHGLPTRPQITRHLGGGRYLIEGMRLNMAGEWTLVVGVEAGGRRDIARFVLDATH